MALNVELTSTGLIIDTLSNVIAYYTAAYQAIYGASINLNSNTPDGQMVGIQSQAVIDVEQLLLSVYTSFDPNQAIGTSLDMRCAINGIQRMAGTFTVTEIQLVIGNSVNLYGLDQSVQPVYTVSDSAGNQWQLQTTQLGVSPQTISYLFQAANSGAIPTTPNTITTQVTIVLGVTSVNNPSTYLSLGTDEESDAALRIRRAKSVSLPAQGYLSAMYAALANINGVTFTQIYENNTASTSTGMVPPGIPANIPSHSIWIIVGGSGIASQIAQAIYLERNAGVGFYEPSGVNSYAVTQVDGSTFTVYWSDVTGQNLFCVVTLGSLNYLAGVASPTPPNIAAIISNLPTQYELGPNQEANINALATAIQAIDSNSLVLSPGLSSGQAQVITLSGSTSGGSGSAELNYSGSSTIAITPANWTASNLQSKLRTLTGDAALTVSGTSDTGPFTVTFVDINQPTLIGVNSNSLETSGSVPITFGFYSNYASTVNPEAANYEFTLGPTTIVILPMILAGATGTIGIGYAFNANGTVENTTLTIAHGGNTFQFQGLGGYGTLTYSISTSISSTINSSTGLYTSGTSSGSDVVTVTDAQGNSAYCNITVT